jgi:hypothetical protein
MGLAGLLTLLLARPVTTESNAAPAPVPVAPRASSVPTSALPGPAPLTGRAALEAVPAAATPCQHEDSQARLDELQADHDALAGQLAALRRQNLDLLAGRYETFRAGLSVLLARDIGAERLHVKVGSETIDVAVDVRDILLELARHHRIQTVEELRMVATDSAILQTVGVLEAFYAGMIQSGRADWDWRHQRLEAIFAAPIYRSRMR